MADHEWIEVGKRRWCVRCPCFQQKPRMGMKFWNAPPCSDIYNTQFPRPMSDILELALSAHPPADKTPIENKGAGQS